MSAASEYAEALRAIASFYEAHPDVQTPHDHAISVYGVEDTKEEALRIIEALKPCRKEWEGPFLKIVRDFGEVRLVFVFEREAVCTKRVVGVKEIPAEFIPAHTEEIVEWECGPILETRALDAVELTLERP